MVLVLWADLAVMAIVGAWILVRERRELARPARLIAPALVFGLGLVLRLVFSPMAVIHENAHGYEFLGTAFTLEGFFYHGAGYHAFMHLVAMVFGPEPVAVFAVNAVLGAASAAVLLPLGRHILDSREAGIVAGLAQACIPPAVRLGGSESMFPLATFAVLAATWALFFAMRRGCTARFVLSASLVAFGMQVRPEMALWPLVLALCVPLEPGFGDGLRRRGPWIAMAWFVALASPWIWFRVQVASREGVPGFLRLGPLAFVESFFSSDNLLFSFAWIPEIVWALALAGLATLAWRRPRALAPIVGGLVVVAWLVVGVRSGFATRMRLQTTLLPFLCLAAGGGAAWLSGLLGPRRRYAGLAAACVLVVVSSMARVPAAATPANTQYEFDFLARTTGRIPPECVLVTADRFMGNGIVSTEFPWWLHERVEQSQFLEGQDNAGHEAPGSCFVFYRGLSCRSFTHEETANLPADGLRHECRVVERLYRLETMEKVTFENRPDSYLIVPGDTVTVGFYRLRPR